MEVVLRDKFVVPEEAKDQFLEAVHRSAACRDCKVIFDYSRSRMILEPPRGGKRNR